MVEATSRFSVSRPPKAKKRALPPGSKGRATVHERKWKDDGSDDAEAAADKLVLDLQSKGYDLERGNYSVGSESWDGDDERYHAGGYEHRDEESTRISSKQGDREDARVASHTYDSTTYTQSSYTWRSGLDAMSSSTTKSWSASHSGGKNESNRRSKPFRFLPSVISDHGSNGSMSFTRTFDVSRAESYKRGLSPVQTSTAQGSVISKSTVSSIPMPKSSSMSEYTEGGLDKWIDNSAVASLDIKTFSKLIAEDFSKKKAIGNDPLDQRPLSTHQRHVNQLRDLSPATGEELTTIRRQTASKRSDNGSSSALSTRRSAAIPKVATNRRGSPSGEDDKSRHSSPNEQSSHMQHETASKFSLAKRGFKLPKDLTSSTHSVADTVSATKAEPPSTSSFFSSVKVSLKESSGFPQEEKNSTLNRQISSSKIDANSIGESSRQDNSFSIDKSTTGSRSSRKRESPKISESNSSVGQSNGPRSVDSFWSRRRKKIKARRNAELVATSIKSTDQPKVIDKHQHHSRGSIESSSIPEDGKARRTRTVDRAEREKTANVVKSTTHVPMRRIAHDLLQANENDEIDSDDSDSSRMSAMDEGSDGEGNPKDEDAYRRNGKHPKKGAQKRKSSAIGSHLSRRKISSLATRPDDEESPGSYHYDPAMGADWELISEAELLRGRRTQAPSEYQSGDESHHTERRSITGKLNRVLGRRITKNSSTATGPMSAPESGLSRATRDSSHASRNDSSSVATEDNESATLSAKKRMLQLLTSPLKWRLGSEGQLTLSPDPSLLPMSDCESSKVTRTEGHPVEGGDSRHSRTSVSHKEPFSESGQGGSEGWESGSLDSEDERGSKMSRSTSVERRGSDAAKAGEYRAKVSSSFSAKLGRSSQETMTSIEAAQSQDESSEWAGDQNVVDAPSRATVASSKNSKRSKQSAGLIAYSESVTINPFDSQNSAESQQDSTVLLNPIASSHIGKRGSRLLRGGHHTREEYKASTGSHEALTNDSRNITRNTSGYDMQRQSTLLLQKSQVRKGSWKVRSRFRSPKVISALVPRGLPPVKECFEPSTSVAKASFGKGLGERVQTIFHDGTGKHTSNEASDKSTTTLSTLEDPSAIFIAKKSFVRFLRPYKSKKQKINAKESVQAYRDALTKAGGEPGVGQQEKSAPPVDPVRKNESPEPKMAQPKIPALNESQQNVRIAPTERVFGLFNHHGYQPPTSHQRKPDFNSFSRQLDKLERVKQKGDSTSSAEGTTTTTTVNSMEASGFHRKSPSRRTVTKVTLVEGGENPESATVRPESGSRLQHAVKLLLGRGSSKTKSKHPFQTATANFHEEVADLHVSLDEEDQRELPEGENEIGQEDHRAEIEVDDMPTNMLIQHGDTSNDHVTPYEPSIAEAAAAGIVSLFGMGERVPIPNLNATSQTTEAVSFPVSQPDVGLHIEGPPIANKIDDVADGMSTSSKASHSTHLPANPSCNTPMNSASPSHVGPSNSKAKDPFHTLRFRREMANSDILSDPGSSEAACSFQDNTSANTDSATTSNVVGVADLETAMTLQDPKLEVRISPSQSFVDAERQILNIENGIEFGACGVLGECLCEAPSPRMAIERKEVRFSEDLVLIREIPGLSTASIPGTVDSPSVWSMESDSTVEKNETPQVKRNMFSWFRGRRSRASKHSNDVDLIQERECESLGSVGSSQSSGNDSAESNTSWISQRSGETGDGQSPSGQPANHNVLASTPLVHHSTNLAITISAPTNRSIGPRSSVPIRPVPIRPSYAEPSWTNLPSGTGQSEDEEVQSRQPLAEAPFEADSVYSSETETKPRSDLMRYGQISANKDQKIHNESTGLARLGQLRGLTIERVHNADGAYSTLLEIEKPDTQRRDVGRTNSKRNPQLREGSRGNRASLPSKQTRHIVRLRPASRVGDVATPSIAEGEGIELIAGRTRSGKNAILIARSGGNNDYEVSSARHGVKEPSTKTPSEAAKRQGVPVNGGGHEQTKKPFDRKNRKPKFGRKPKAVSRLRLFRPSASETGRAKQSSKQKDRKVTMNPNVKQSGEAVQRKNKRASSSGTKTSRTVYPKDRSASHMNDQDTKGYHLRGNARNADSASILKKAKLRQTLDEQDLLDTVKCPVGLRKQDPNPFGRIEDSPKTLKVASGHINGHAPSDFGPTNDTGLPALASPFHSREQSNKKSRANEKVNAATIVGELFTWAWAGISAWDQPPPPLPKKADKKLEGKGKSVILTIDSTADLMSTVSGLSVNSKAIDSEAWQDIRETTATLAARYKEQRSELGEGNDDRSISDDTIKEVNEALARFKEHAARLGISERELMLAVHDEHEESIRSGKDTITTVNAPRTNQDFVSRVGSVANGFIDVFEFYYNGDKK